MNTDIAFPSHDAALMLCGTAFLPADLSHGFDAVTGPKELVTIAGAEHHDLYMPGKGFEETMTAATRWFTAQLMADRRQVQ